MAEEAVTNALKHAQATRIGISLRCLHSSIVLSVADNGQGFDLDGTQERGFGLIGMRERMEHVRGELRIDSAPGKGARLEAVVPNRVTL